MAFRRRIVFRRRAGVAVIAGGALVVGAAVRARHDGERWRAATVSTFQTTGDPLACGGSLRAGQAGVAHRTLPCGRIVAFRHRGRTTSAPVIDRGPYVGGREFDLTAATAGALGVEGVERIEWRIP